MADSVGFKVEGLNQLTRELRGLGADVDDLKGAFGTIAAEGAEVAAGFAPRRSGALAASIRGNRAQSKAVVSAGNARRVPYARVINYGWATRGIEASHFLQRTDDVMRPRALAELEREINARVALRGLA